MNKGTGTRARIFRAADHQAVGFVIGHHFGGQLRRVLPFLLLVAEVVQHVGELFGRGKAQRNDLAALDAVVINALNQIHQAVYHRRFAG